MEETVSVGLEEVSVQLADIYELLFDISYGQMVFLGVFAGALIALLLAVMFRD